MNHSSHQQNRGEPKYRVRLHAYEFSYRVIISLQFTCICHKCNPEQEYEKRKIFHASLKTADFNIYVFHKGGVKNWLIYIKDRELAAANSIHTQCWLNNMRAFHYTWTISILLSAPLLVVKFCLFSICCSMKFDSLIIKIDAVRFRQCHCQKFLKSIIKGNLTYSGK